MQCKARACVATAAWAGHRPDGLDLISERPGDAARNSVITLPL